MHTWNNSLFLDKNEYYSRKNEKVLEALDEIA